MQIRLTVVDPLGPPSEPRGRATACDVLVTAPAGTALAAVASGLASAVGEGGAERLERSRETGGGQVVLYAGAERLDAQRCTLGEPPLIDGAVLSLSAPSEPGPEVDEAAAQLHVVAGPDAGGVHLLHGGKIHIGRSADADVPLDDPDVSRLHCAVTLSADGRVSVVDLGSTNGTTLDGTRVGDRPVRLAPGALLRIGESALRLASSSGARGVATTPDGEGHVRVATGGAAAAADDSGAGPGAGSGGGSPTGAGAPGAEAAGHGRAERRTVPGQGGVPGIERTTDVERTTGSAGSGAAGGTGRGDAPGAGRGAVRAGAGEGGGGAFEAEAHGRPRDGHEPFAGDMRGAGDLRGARAGDDGRSGDDGFGSGGEPPESGTRKGTPLRGTDVPRGLRKRGGFGAWARRLTGGRTQPGTEYDPYEYDTEDDEDERGALASVLPAARERLPETWPDPAALLLTALGPGARLWERGPGHPEALTVRLGTTDRAAPDGSGLLPAVPVTTGLREVGALGLAGPRPRLMGLTRAVVAQLAALHSPDTLELVLISADRARSTEERAGDWSWLGWLPHLRPAHGQDCRLLLAYDREQTTARLDELLRRLEDHAADTAGHAPGSTPGAGGGRTTGGRTTPGATGPADRGTGAAEGGTGRRSARRPSWAREDGPAGAGYAGPYTVVIVDGDPGGADVREAVVRLAQEGPVAGIHVVCLAETESASPASPVTETYTAACEVSPAFRACGAVALLSGDVATALRLLRVTSAGSGAVSGAGATGAASAASAMDRASTAGGARSGRTATGPASGGVGGRPGAAHGGAAGRGGDAGRPSQESVDHARGTASDAAPGRPRPDHTERPGRPDRARGSAQADPAVVSRTHTALDLSGGVRSGADERTHPGTRDIPSLDAREAPGLLNHGTVATLDAVSAAWAERFARALAPLRTDGVAGDRQARVSAPLPQSARLLDELGLARATPASLMARWADAGDDTTALGGRAWAVLGAGPRGPVSVDLVAEGPHLLIEGPAGSGRTELLRAVAASLAAAERPDRLGMVLVDGRDGGAGGGAGGGRAGEGLGVCTDLPHVGTHLTANDPVRMREFAQSLIAELKRRYELLGGLGFMEWHTRREVSGRIVPQRSATSATAGAGPAKSAAPGAGSSGAGASGPGSAQAASAGAADLDSSSSSTLRLRPGRRTTEDGRGGSGKSFATELPRLIVIVDDLDALLSPPLGSTGRPAAGSVVRALEAVAREGERLGVHLVATTGGGGPKGESELGRAAGGRVVLSAPVPGPDEPAPGRGELRGEGGRTTAFQAGRVTGRIPRTATLRPTVVPLDWTRMGDPPARRPVRELGNGPTDLALLASALDRAAREVSAPAVPSLL
ncbi:FHA domain-containing protein [Streptomyces caniscabiei]|uniref:FHA domain-containing protein n=2 Tax=Streptomyces caniscabiei TaxID=2746961 RepID=A0A927LAP3_9ACTN|nr:FHA domain-containing protein [Streptomyces caniscabiei]MBD9728827.1 FHA domain-containing protein [Streptomyces caniscabiei]MDX3514028.1 FHA domain-containing protein [Streptomyces caniscabiei]MDX3723376.1 FHA domain-containing protein [Streptomyces caniscabiei]WEO30106.1 FHA domain-containing protein [Streptomyces caniscabiei]